MAIDLNNNPYYDDFDGTKNYHQILFRPGETVQARELTQIQSILKDQIKRFGDHVFQHGSVVIPGNSYADLSASYVKVNRSYNNVTLDLQYIEGKTIRSTVTGVKATVRKAVDFGDLGFVVLYVSYIAGGANGETLFTADEVLEESGPGQVSLKTYTASSGDTEDVVGVGSLAFVNQGVYYINGVFGYVPTQSVVISAYDSLPTCSVVLRIAERIVTSNTDETLLDPAQDSYNYAAPGADRLQLILTLDRVDTNSVTSTDLVELMRYDNGELLEHSRYPKYSELEKSLARRTYDESGDYVVGGLLTNLQEHLKSGVNGGAFPPPVGDKDAIMVNVSPGKAYIQGFEVEKFGRSRIKIDKGRTPAHIKSTVATFRPRFGSYILVKDLKGTFSTASQQPITLWNSANPADGTATQIGTARIVAVDFHVNSADPIYKVYLSDYVLNATYTAEDVGGLRFTEGAVGSGVVVTEIAGVPSGAVTIGETFSSPTGNAGILRFHDTAVNRLYFSKKDSATKLPRAKDTLTGETSNTQLVCITKLLVGTSGIALPIFPTAKAPVSSLRSESGQWNIRYIAQKELTLTTNSGGAGSVSVSSGSINAPEVGSFFAFTANGSVSPSLFSVNNSGDTLSITGGPASTTIRINCHVTKQSVAPKTKTLKTHTQTVTAVNGVLTLAKYDVYSLTSITLAGADVKNSVVLDNGQRDYRYDYGTITGRGSKLVGAYEVTYQYFEHSITGDFFCIDSYAGNADYMDLNVIHSFNAVDIDLLNSIDFRRAVGVSSDLIVSETPFESDLQFYVPRIDAVVVNKSGLISVVTGTPSENPKPPALSGNQMPLDYVFIPAYTKTLASAAVSRVAVNSYRMVDISKIEDRIENLEEFATLTAAEVEATKYEILDAETGLNRFKTGYLVESFEDPFKLARTTSDQYAASFIAGELHAATEVLECELRLSNTSGVVNKNGYAFMDYAEQTLISQPLSSRITNVNPFLIIKWDGILRIDPPKDEWVEVLDLPTIFEKKTEYVQVGTPVSPAAPVATPSFGAGGATPIFGPFSPGGSTTSSGIDPGLLSFINILTGNGGPTGETFVGNIPMPQSSPSGIDPGLLSFINILTGNG